MAKKITFYVLSSIYDQIFQLMLSNDFTNRNMAQAIPNTTSQISITKNILATRNVVKMFSAIIFLIFFSAVLFLSILYY